MILESHASMRHWVRKRLMIMMKMNDDNDGDGTLGSLGAFESTFKNSRLRLAITYPSIHRLFPRAPSIF